MKINTFLQDLEFYLKENNFNIYDVCISTHENKPVLLKMQNIDFLPNSYSVAKSFCVCACGFLYDEGKLDLNEPITKILKEYINFDYDPLWDCITVHDCLKHKIGLENGWLDIDAQDPKTFGEDYLKYTLQAKFKYMPKIDYTYTDAAFYLVSRVVAKKSGMDLEDYLKEKLFKPLDILKYRFDKCPYGYSMGATGLYLDTIDTIKLPILLLNNGIYNNIRILSKEWMDILESNQYENYYFDESGWYQKAGMRNQMIMYNKRYDVAVAWHGCDEFSPKLRKYFMINITSKMEY